MSPFGSRQRVLRGKPSVVSCTGDYKPWPPCDSSSLSYLSLKFWETLGPFPYPAKALDTTVFMSTERLLEGQAPACQGVSSLLFVYFVSVVTKGQAWVSGATCCWDPSCLCT